MKPSDTPTSQPGPWFALVALLPAVLLATPALPWSWLSAWLGRMHPLVLHFPIALLLLVGLLEVLMVAGRGRWVFPVRLILFIGSAGAVKAATFGILLMNSEALEGDLVDRHLWSGGTVAVLSVVALALRLAPGCDLRGGLRTTYRIVLAAVCAVVVFASHYGATLTHGEGYLTETLPWAAGPATVVSFPQDRPVEEWEIFSEVVAPILAVRCYECHRGSNFKGKLVLDDWESLMRGGASGPLFVSGKPDDSLLISRLLLSIDHKEHMPPRRKAQPDDTEIELLRRWVAAGAPAKGTLASLGADAEWIAHVQALPAALGEVTAPEVVAELDAVEVAALRASLAEAVEDLQQRYPGVVDYESRQSAFIEVNASLLGAAFGDTDLAALASLRANIVRLDLAGTAVTDRGLALLAGMDRLRVLRLNETGITDEGMRHLRTLESLESLGLFRTRVTDAALEHIASLPNLKTWAVAETAVTAEALAALRARRL